MENLQCNVGKTIKINKWCKMKTTFSSGVVVTSEWLNGAKRIFFDGQDLDWHYNPLGLESLALRGPNGLDSRYVTLGTEQPSLSSTGVYISGSPVSGDKVVTGKWLFGYDPNVNPTIDQDLSNAPLSYLTNLKYEYANGIVSPSISQKFGALVNSDLITKQILSEQISGISLNVDNGTY